MFTVSIAVVGAADLDDLCGFALFPAYANFLNVYGEINSIDLEVTILPGPQHLSLRFILLLCHALVQPGRR